MRWTVDTHPVLVLSRNRWKNQDLTRQLHHNSEEAKLGKKMQKKVFVGRSVQQTGM